MSQQRIESLKNQHASLDYELSKLGVGPIIDLARFQGLKKKKLLIKDQLSNFLSRSEPPVRVEIAHERNTVSELG
jgi:hypothetical protein